MKRHGWPDIIVTGKLRSYGDAMKTIGNAHRQETGRWLNNRSENSHPLPDSGLLANHEKGPSRRRERAFGECEDCKNFTPFKPRFTTISNRNARFTAETILI